MEPQADIGVIGLAVMGRNLILNMADHGFTVAAYNRTTERVDEFLAGEAADASVVGAYSLEDLVGVLVRPRRVMLMVRAGDPVDATIDNLVPLLEPGDIVIDGGNSEYTDTIRRTSHLEEQGLHFVGTGISGGEEGARHGPSIMPGGSTDAWEHVRPILQSIAAVADDGTPCCDWIGNDGAGHYVKMVHNGIEYGDMQVIAEAFDLLRRGAGIATPELAPVFAEWNRGKLDSFLIEITADILGFTDDEGDPLVEKILDAAGQKGTGKWTVISSMLIGMPTSLIAEAVYGRIVSSLVEQRLEAATELGAPVEQFEDPADEVIADLHDALYASKIVSYAQGFMLMAAASAEHGWKIDLGSIARLWRAGCIIRSRFLNDITAAFRDSPDLPSLLLDAFFRDEIAAAEPGWRRTVVRAVRAGIPTPAYSSALAFYDAYRSARLPANLIQAQRDYFGAHTYERIDRPRGQHFHTNWTGTGGSTSAGTYDA
jgi:6-phosphogluconate dehydrogenase